MNKTDKPLPAERFCVLALQTICDAINQDQTAEQAHERMQVAIKRVSSQIAGAKGFLKSFNGHDLKLVVLPEYWMTGFPMKESRSEWQAKAAIDIDSHFSDKIAEIAQKFQLYLCSNHYENDPHFPDLYFQSNILYDPSGNTILRYRRLISLYTPSPYDVWDQYLDHYGQDAIFPTIDTEIGVLATIASEEILYPEIARMHALNGAELFLHPTSEVGMPGLTPKDIAKRARALENLSYLISANSAGIQNIPVPSASTDFMSKIVDWKGTVVAEAAGGESMNANAIIDLDGLRLARRQTGMSNFLSRLPLTAFQQGYQQKVMPPNRTPDAKMIEKEAVLKAQNTVIESLQKNGIIK